MSTDHLPEFCCSSDCDYFYHFDIRADRDTSGNDTIITAICHPPDKFILCREFLDVTPAGSSYR